MQRAEWLPLKKVAVRSPDSAVAGQSAIDDQWRELRYGAKPDLSAAIDEHNAFTGAIRAAGSDIVALPAGSGLTFDSIYARDTALPAPDGVILTTMGKDQRRAEPDRLADALETVGLAVAGRIEAPGTFEGGDCVWIDEKTLLVGRTYRTNDDGIRQVRNMLGPDFTVEVFHMPHYKGTGDVFHLMSVLSPVGPGLAVCYPPLTPVPLMELMERHDIRVLEVPDNEFESMGCNILALGNGAVIMVEGNPGIKTAMESAGLAVTEISGDHICHPGQGGPTCLTLPLLRTDGA